MTPADYYLNKTLRTGSSFYYSLLFVTPPQRIALIALASFWQTVNTILMECSDPGIARQKLYWWQDEINKISTGKVAHPIAQTLIQVQQQYQLDFTVLQEIIQALIYRLDHPHFSTQQELLDYCQQTLGNLMQLRAKILSYKDPMTLRCVDEMGIALQLIYLLQHLRAELKQGYLYLPEEMLQAEKVDMTTLYQFQMSAELHKVLAVLSQLTREKFFQALENFPAIDRKSQSANIILGQLKILLLDEIERAGFPVFTQRVSITPLRKLLRAWWSNLWL